MFHHLMQLLDNILLLCLLTVSFGSGQPLSNSRNTNGERAIPFSFSSVQSPTTLESCKSFQTMSEVFMHMSPVVLPTAVTNEISPWHVLPVQAGCVDLNHGILGQTTSLEPNVILRRIWSGECKRCVSFVFLVNNAAS